MFNVYDRYSLTFNDDEKAIVLEFISEIQDFNDYIIIKTPVTIGDIRRGWTGDITFNLSGFDVEKSFSDEDRVKENFTLKDALCSARTFEAGSDFAPMWQYKFMKY